MTEVRRILCATDLSTASAPAWAAAQRLASGIGAELTLVHVVPWLPLPVEGGLDPGTYQRLTDDGRAEARRELEGLAAGVADPGLRVRVQVDDGPAAPRILAAVDAGRADLLVLGTHGRTGLNRLLVGSVAEQLIQLAHCPMMTVRPLPFSEATRTRPIRRLLYPTDFSPSAAAAWPWVRALAEASGAEVDLLHVMLEVVPDRHVDPAFLTGAAAAIREDAQRAMDRLVATADLPRERLHVHLVHGAEAEQIVRVAHARLADITLMGTHGRTGLLRLALGSVTRRVLHEAPCPVLTVGPSTAS
jgi:nucleotide-binding universal stress UspA family protein